MFRHLVTIAILSGASLLVAAAASLLVAAAASLLVAAAQAAPAQHSPEFTDHNDQDPGAIPELSEIVALCATEPGSAEFDRAWTRWVAANPQADIDKTVADVIGRAKTMHSMTSSAAEVKSARSRHSEEEIADRMRRLAAAQNQPKIRVLSLPKS